MKSFRRLREFYQLTGTHPSQHNHFINIRILFILTVLSSYFASTFAFFLYDAAEVIELASAFFQSITAIAVILNFIVHFWKTPAALDLIHNFDEFIEKSKFWEMFVFKFTLLDLFQFRIDSSRCQNDVL